VAVPTADVTAQPLRVGGGPAVGPGGGADGG
jgi:hypothetical protein